MRKIFMAVLREKERDMVFDWFKEKFHFSFMQKPRELFSGSFDLCILDAEAFTKYRPFIIERRNMVGSNPPKFLSMFARSRIEKMEDKIKDSLDDIVFLPLSKFELELRILTQLRLKFYEQTLNSAEKTAIVNPMDSAASKRPKELKTLSSRGPEERTRKQDGKINFYRKTRIQILDLPAAIKIMGGKESILEKVCDSFIKELPKKMEHLKQCISRKDYTGAQRMAHDLKTGAKCVCAEKAAELSFQMETHSMKKRRQKIDETLPLLEDAFVELLQELRAYRKA